MRNMASLSDLPWLCLGDFNEVLSLEEYDGIGKGSQSQIQGFRDVVDIFGMVDLGFQGQPWTFEKRVSGGTYTRVRLDRALGSSEWCAQFPLALVEHLTSATSDHSPLLVKLAASGHRLEKSFKYEVMWEMHPDLKRAVDSVWEPNSRNRTASEVRANLTALANELGEWSKATFGSVRGEIKKLKCEIEKLRSDPARTGPSNNEIKINDS
ncbi:uncharacterized protein [Aegilops tauschii subsp. strangulata]|uniref:uncharacterized protein n=1 Tax=Aegilops tauschii subsp. strangulata TaxID=200361 RepID=UPI003CC8E079